MPRAKRILAISDTHCGHAVGLTPPDWQWGLKGASNTKWNKYAEIQGQLWNHYISLVKSLAPIDIVFFLGDAIDGKGKRSGSTELVTADLQEQCEMAVGCFEALYKANGKKPKVIGVYGTPYHTSEDGQDYENLVAMQAGWDDIGSHEWVDVNGCVFDLKHKIGSSSIPHGRATAVLRDALWNLIWSSDNEQPRAQVLLRGHAHFYIAVDHPAGLAAVLPSLQGMGSKYGSRQCSGTVHWGGMHFDVDSKGVVEWDRHLVKIEAQAAKAIKL